MPSSMWKWTMQASWLVRCQNLYKKEIHRENDQTAVKHIWASPLNCSSLRVTYLFFSRSIWASNSIALFHCLRSKSLYFNPVMQSDACSEALFAFCCYICKIIGFNFVTSDGVYKILPVFCQYSVEHKTRVDIAKQMIEHSSASTFRLWVVWSEMTKLILSNKTLLSPPLAFDNISRVIVIS